MKTLFSAAFSLLLFQNVLLAQFMTAIKNNSSNIIKNGIINYKVTVEGEDPQAKMLNNSTFEYAFSGTDSKLTGLVLGGAFAANVLVDATTKKGLALLTIFGQKKAMKMSPEDIQKAQNNTATIDASKIIPISGTQTVAGHVCRKVMLKNPENPNMQTVVFVCDKIKPDGGGVVDNVINALKGFPLGMEVKVNGSKISLMASEVSTKIPKKADFKHEIPADFQETTMEKFREEMEAFAPKKKD
jgi:hypothetical protein